LHSPFPPVRQDIEQDSARRRSLAFLGFGAGTDDARGVLLLRHVFATRSSRPSSTARAGSVGGGVGGRAAQLGPRDRSSGPRPKREARSPGDCLAARLPESASLCSRLPVGSRILESVRSWMFRGQASDPEVFCLPFSGPSGTGSGSCYGGYSNPAPGRSQSGIPASRHQWRLRVYRYSPFRQERNRREYASRRAGPHPIGRLV
jgi:hypothetical protein